MEFKRPFTEIEWTATPPAVRQYIEMLEKSILHLTETIADLKGRTEKLERRVNRNSQNSSQPSSTELNESWSGLCQENPIRLLCVGNSAAKDFGIDIFSRKGPGSI